MITHPEPSTLQTDESERDLVARLKAGQPEAYEELVRTVSGRLLAVARRMLRDDEAARDAVQDALLSAYRGIQSFDGQARLSTWMHRIVVNAALMKIRSRQRRPEQSIEPLLPRFAEDGHHAEPVTCWAESAEQRLEREEMTAVLRAAIDDLPDSYRVVILLRDIEGLSTLEAARAVGTTENALKLRLHRARQALSALVRQRLDMRPSPLRRPAVTARPATRMTGGWRAPAIPLAV